MDHAQTAYFLKAPLQQAVLHHLHPMQHNGNAGHGCASARSAYGPHLATLPYPNAPISTCTFPMSLPCLTYATFLPAPISPTTTPQDPDSLTTTPKATPHRSRPPQIQLPNASAILTAENGGSPGSPGPGPFSHGGSGPLSPGSGGGRPCFHVRCYARGVPLRETLLPAELVETALPLHLRPGAAAKRQRCERGYWAWLVGQEA